ncbi:hypothetical protein LOZ86_11370 [Pectobacterium parvum]|uniref:Streptomycin biosynthesis enzyme StrG n=2 Tax=Pectobacterium parvum TaxID=2778550 RepID=A0ABW8FTK3_9GAMM|nr:MULTISPECIES: hypothetical protein [Pectobacterium]MCU1802178.1 hypothetical protein [Pectobacterium parvum]UFK37600.1 hypothetical protein LOZ86_11370 [Pectobacterium parvum]UVD95697.1 hypothetical protein NV347_11375 [Pectobacterium parvum]GKW43781.1 hypothetical protein PEC301879_36390 [Pectobacterium carotovorum subsp. carotovorum]
MINGVLDSQGYQGDKKLMILRYDTREFPFAWAFKKEAFFGLSLSRLHEHCIRAHEKKGRATRLSTEDMTYLRNRMRAVPENGLFYSLYHRFIKNLISSHFGEKIVYTEHPEMRVHLAGLPACSAWHTDAQVTGRYDQVNVWMPFVDTNESCCLWIETDYGRKDFRPIPVRYGEALIFDGSCLNHGTVKNDSNVTRVSLDFRFTVKTRPLPALFKQLVADRPLELSAWTPSFYSATG